MPPAVSICWMARLSRRTMQYHSTHDSAENMEQVMNRQNIFKVIIAAVIILSAGLAGGVTPAHAQGSPTFTIERWSTDPVELQRGQEFNLTFVFTNVGSLCASEVTVNLAQSGNFTTLSPTQYFGGMCTHVPVTAQLRVAVSNSITTGPYSIPILFTFQSDNFQHTPGSETREIGVHVQGLAPSSGADTGRPQIVIETAEAAPLEEGGGLNLVLTLRNTGNRVATNVVVSLDGSTILSPAEGGTAFALGRDIAVNGTQQISLALVLLEAPTERLVQDFRIEWASYSGGSYQSTQGVTVDLGEAVGQAPRLLIESYSTNPETISPGATFRLDLELVNVGGSAARQVFFRLGGDSADLGPLAPLGSSNVSYLEEIGAGERLTVSYDLVADGDAEAGLVPIDIGMEYNDQYGVLRTETVTISLVVVATPYLDIGLFDTVPDPIVVGDVFELPVEVINVGATQINVNTVEVTSSDLVITEGSLYIGPLDAGRSEEHTSELQSP